MRTIAALTCSSCDGVAIRSLIPLLIQIGRRKNPEARGWFSATPFRLLDSAEEKSTHVQGPRRQIAPSHWAHLAPPEMPANATGHWIDFGQSRCTTFSPAVRSASLSSLSRSGGRPCSMVSAIQPSLPRRDTPAHSRTVPGSLVSVTIRTGQAPRERSSVAAARRTTCGWSGIAVCDPSSW